MSQTNVPDLNSWLEHLRHANKSENTLRAYQQRVLRFAEWFESTNGETLTHERVTPTDLREYKSYLLINLKRTPLTANLSFIAIANWLDFNGQNMPMPSNVEEVCSAPQGLDRLGQRSLTRAVERKCVLRDIALITLMLNTGLRISEVAALDIDDLILVITPAVLRYGWGKGKNSAQCPSTATPGRPCAII